MKLPRLFRKKAESSSPDTPKTKSPRFLIEVAPEGFEVQFFLPNIAGMTEEEIEESAQNLASSVVALTYGTGRGLAVMQQAIGYACQEAKMYNYGAYVLRLINKFSTNERDFDGPVVLPSETFWNKGDD